MRFSAITISYISAGWNDEQTNNVIICCWHKFSEIDRIGFWHEFKFFVGMLYIQYKSVDYPQIALEFTHG